jgi:hypothetical protein
MRFINTRYVQLGAAGLAAAVLLGGVSATADEFTRPSGGKTRVHKNGKVLRVDDKAEARTTSIGHTSMEPTIAIDSGGEIFMTAGSWTDTPGVSTGGATEIVRSSDGAETWSFVTPKILGQSHQRVSLDPYVYVDELDGDNSRVFSIDLTAACSYMSFSDDDGQSWITNPLACGRPVNDHQTLFSGPPVSTPTVNYPNILYYCWNDVASSACSKSLDGGLTFHPTGTPAFPGYDTAEDGGFCGGLHGHGVVDSKGTIYLPREYCGRPYVSVSKDEGLTWTNYRVSKKAAGGGSDTSVAVDKKGNVYYLWLGEDRLPYLATSRNGGQKWSKPVAVAPPGLKEANLPSIDARGVGKIALVYYGSENSPFVVCDENCPSMDYTKTTWNGYLTISGNALDDEPVFYTGLASKPSDPLVRQKCGPGRCHNVMDFVDVRIGPDGVAYAAFVDVCMPGPAPEPGCTSKTPNNAFGPGTGLSEGLVTKIVGGPSLN